MVQPQMKCSMGQAGLCALTAPNTDSLSPLVSGDDDGCPSVNGTFNDIQSVLSQLMDDPKELKVTDVLMKLQSVINENIELKDTIGQNNLALRQQLNLMVQWNQQVENQHRQFRQNINELSKNLSTAQQENSLLRSTLAHHNNSGSSGTIYQEWHETIQNLNKQIEAADMNLERALEEKELFLNQRIQLEGQVTLLNCDITTSRSECERLHIKVQEFSSTVQDLQKKLTYNNRSSNKFDDRTEKVDDEGTMASLLSELQVTRNKFVFLETEVKSAKEDVHHYKSRYNELSSRGVQDLDVNPLSSSSDRKLADDAEKRRLRDEAAMLRDEVDTQETALTRERKHTSEERATVSRMHAEISYLKKELEGIREKTDRNEYNDQYYQAKIRSIHEQHDEATAKLVSYEELLGCKNNEISRYKRELGQLKAQMAEFNSESETIAVLRAQVEVYQSDFRAEREGREALATDREKLRDEMRHLHTRNTQLMDELEAYQRRHFNQGSGRSPRAGSEELSPSTGARDSSSMNPDYLWEKLSVTSEKKEEDTFVEVDENLLYCPKCNKPFTELRPLEEHVNKCLDED